MKASRLLPGIASAVLLAWSPIAVARQPESKPPAPEAKPEINPAAAPEGVPDAVPKEFIAREFVRLALMDLRAVTKPTPDDYQAALILLGLARDLDPEDTGIMRRQIEAAFNAGDQNAVLEHTRALIRADPKDTVAQLRFISSSVTREHQTAEARLAAYDRYVASTAIDASIRSRLALDAALLARERGDEKGFNQRLIQACQLDSTYKEAAALAVTVYADRFPEDAVGRMDLQVNLLKADPMDPNVHLSIARTLAAAGAYKAAQRFHSTALTILSIVGSLGDETLVESRVLKWYAEGPGAVVQALAEAVAAERDAAAREIKRLQMARKPFDTAKKPEEITLTPLLATLSVLASDAAGDRPSVLSQLKELTQRVEKQMTDLKDPKLRAGLTEEQAADNTAQLQFQLNSLRLWVNADVDKIEQGGAAFERLRKISPDSAALQQAFQAIRAGRAAEGLEQCQKLPESRTVRMATGIAYEGLGDTERAIRIYTGLVREETLQMTGVWANSRLLALGVKPAANDAERFEKLVADPRVPSWIHSMALQPASVVRVTSSIPPGAGPLALAPIRLSITNQSPIALSLGTDRALSSRFAMLPKLDHEMMERGNRPEVVDVDRRLRLMPQETLTVEIEPAPAQTGWLLSAQAWRTVRVRWELVQGFIIDPAVGFRPGPLGQAVETEAIVLPPLADAMLEPEALAERVTASPIGSLSRFVLLARSMALQPLFIVADGERDRKPKPKRDLLQPAPAAAGGPAPVNIKPVAQALAARLPTLSLPMRQMVALIAPHARLSPDMVILDDAVKADPDPTMRCIALCTRVVDPADELLKSSLTSDDPRVRQVAIAVQARLATSAKMYSRMSPDDFKPAIKPDGK